MSDVVGHESLHLLPVRGEPFDEQVSVDGVGQVGLHVRRRVVVLPLVVVRVTETRERLDDVISGMVLHVKWLIKRDGSLELNTQWLTVRMIGHILDLFIQTI